MTSSHILERSVKSLPLKWYYDDKHHAKEVSKIWSKEWFYACHENALKEPLSYITVNIDNFNVVVLRDKNNSLVAYINTCRHRGSILCKEKQGKLKSNLLTCPYHQWAYNASDGRLIKTTSIIDPKNFKKSDHSLVKVKMKVWHGLIFLNFNNKAKWDLKKVFVDYSSAFNKLNVEDYEVGHIWSKTINCNWKIFWENYSECLHCPNLHPELSEMVPLYGRRLVDIKDDPQWKKFINEKDPKFQGGLKNGAETWSMDGSAQGHKTKYLEDQKDFPGYIYMTTWPSMFLAIFTDHIRTVRILPLGNETTEVTAEWLFTSKTINDKKYKMKSVVDFSVTVMEQDGEACELNQKGVHNPSIKSGVLMPEEYEIKKFHDWLKRKI